jgi:pyruvate kinase
VFPAHLRVTPGVPRRTKIVVTLGPASNSPEMIRKLTYAGMDVARLNFSHGSYEDHARTVSIIREISDQLDTPVTILQDLQGPKIRVGRLPGGSFALQEGEIVTLIADSEYQGRPGTIPIDYAFASEEATSGTPILLADGLFELLVESVRENALVARVLRGGELTNRKGVNFPSLNLNLPSLTPKDEEDVDFGIAQGVDVISLSFVRTADDVRRLKERIAAKGVQIPVIAKIEKPQGVANLDEILDEVQGVMVARGDLGVEMNPERVPMLQKHIIEQCNRRGLPVITATQMLESMIHEARPTRAEVSDVANAIIDGTDAVMLSGESAMGAYPVQAVETMARIAAEVESNIVFKSYPRSGGANAFALGRGVKAMAETVEPRCVVVFSDTAVTALAVAAERLRAPVVALTTELRIYHALNLVWGIRPILVQESSKTMEGQVNLASSILRQRCWVAAGESILVLGGGREESNFVKIHQIS